MSEKTGIDSKRLGQIRAGKGDKPTRSEIGKLSRFKIIDTKKTQGQEVTLDDIKRSTGMSKDEIRKALSGGSAKVTKKYVNDDTYLLKTKDNTNYLLMMVIHVNLQTGNVDIGLSKRFEFKILGDTGTRYEEFKGASGKRYAFTITVFRLHRYTNLKSQVETAIKQVVATKNERVESDAIDTLLDLTGYV